MIQTRREFIKYLSLGILGGFAILWYSLTKKHISLTGGAGIQKINLSGKPDGFYFFDSFIAAKKGASINIFSNRCTHAGCKVNKVHGNTIVCACHGSAYDFTGEVVKGPAIQKLKTLPYTVNPVSGEITVRM